MDRFLIMDSPIVCTVDIVLLSLHQGALHVALFAREREPFLGLEALPGGFVHAQEDLDTRDTARRVLREKTGLDGVFVEQLATFSGPGRDPRGWSISVAYYALVPESLLEQARSRGLRLRPVDSLQGLPFDHAHIVRCAVQRVRDKSLYSSLPVYLCGERFTLPQLQAVYEAVLGEPINKVSFRRKIEELGIVEEIPGEMERGRASRPAQLYRLKKTYQSRLSTTGRGFFSAAQP